MMHEALLFDMDGVIVDTYHSVTTFWRQLATEHDIHLTQEDFVQRVYGRTSEHTLVSLFPHLTEQQRQVILAEIDASESSERYQGVRGITTVLRLLKSYGVPMALVTSGTKAKVRAVLQQLAIDDCFTTQVTAEDIQHGKPDPECYLRAAQALKKPPHACVVFEDAISGVKAAVAAGALCIGIQSPYNPVPLLEAGAHAVVPDFMAITFDVVSPGELVLSLQQSPQDGPCGILSGGQVYPIGIKLRYGDEGLVP
jgi:HAD superfamily hydrolase (TIGR01549 family)